VTHPLDLRDELVARMLQAHCLYVKRADDTGRYGECALRLRPPKAAAICNATDIASCNGRNRGTSVCSKEFVSRRPDQCGVREETARLRATVTGNTGRSSGTPATNGEVSVIRIWPQQLGRPGCHPQGVSRRRLRAFPPISMQNLRAEVPNRYGSVLPAARRSKRTKSAQQPGIQ
jgi:hypothetical protein